MCDSNDKLTTSHSFYSSSQQRTKEHINSNWKSDTRIYGDSIYASDRDSAFKKSNEKCREYYKRYEHEVPVKDFINSNSLIGTGDNQRIALITSSLLGRLEHKVLKKYESQELQTDGSSFESLDSHIKIFQTTVQKIFDIFHTHMRDYDVYKQRYEEIMEKNKADNLAEMEWFIKDMIQHIVSTEPSITSFTSNLTYAVEDTEIKASDQASRFDTIKRDDNIVLESYKNNHLIESNTEENDTEENASSKKQSIKSGEVYNIYLMSTSPLTEIKVNDRNMYSEINIKDHQPDVDLKIASADNLRRNVFKKDFKVYYEHEDPSADREIPIKSSCPKKNIHLNEDFKCQHDSTERSFLSRLCSYICKKFRK